MKRSGELKIWVLLKLLNRSFRSRIYPEVLVCAPFLVQTKPASDMTNLLQWKCFHGTCACCSVHLFLLFVCWICVWGGGGVALCLLTMPFPPHVHNYVWRGTWHWGPFLSQASWACRSFLLNVQGVMPVSMILLISLCIQNPHKHPNMASCPGKL